MSISDLDSVIAKLRYVKFGDFVLSDDHNDLVDAVKIIRDILQDMQEKLEEIGSQTEKGAVGRVGNVLKFLSPSYYFRGSKW